MDYGSELQRIKSMVSGCTKIMALDLETWITKGFLKNERIIAVSIATIDGYTEIFTGDYGHDDQIELIGKLSVMMDEYKPEVIIGYNHTSYDIPLMNTNTVNMAFGDKFWPMKYYLGTSYVLDMMYVCALHGATLSGEYRIRSLKKVVSAPEYSHLNLLRSKDEIDIPGMSKGDAIVWAWKNARDSFLRYCRGDVQDLIELYRHIFM